MSGSSAEGTHSRIGVMSSSASPVNSRGRHRPEPRTPRARICESVCEMSPSCATDLSEGSVDFIRHVLQASSSNRYPRSSSHPSPAEPRLERWLVTRAVPLPLSIKNARPVENVDRAALGEGQRRALRLVGHVLVVEGSEGRRAVHALDALDHIARLGAGRR